MRQGLLAGMTLLLASCGTAQVAMAPPGQDAAGKQFDPPPPGMAAVYFYNPMNSGPVINVMQGALVIGRAGAAHLDTRRNRAGLVHPALRHVELGQSLVDHAGGRRHAVCRSRQAARCCELHHPGDRPGCRPQRRAVGRPRAAAGVAVCAQPRRQLAVGLGDQLEQVAVGVLEIDAAAAPVVVDLARPFLVRTGEIGEPGMLHPSEGGVEFPSSTRKA